MDTASRRGGRAGRRGLPSAMRFLCAALGAALSLGACAEPVQLTALPGPAAGQRAGVPTEAELFRLPAEGPAPKLNLPVPTRFELSNGTRVLVVERHTVPLVAMVVAWPFGALEDPGDRPGMASLCADMLDEGAGSRGPLELADALGRLGARLSTRASFNATLVDMLTLSRNLEPSLKLLADVVRRPTINDKELARVKADTLTHLKQRHDSPQSLAHDAFEAALYAPGRRGAPAAGTQEAVALLDHYDCRWWHRERLRPDDAALIVVGDVDTAQLKGQLEAELGAWRPPERRRELPPLGKVPPATRRLVAVDLPGKAQTVIQVGEPSVPRNHPDYFPLLVMNAVLGGQFNSRLNMNLREKHGWAYGASSEFTFSRDGGPFYMRAQVKGPSAKEALGEMMREAAAIRTGEVGEAELRQAKDTLGRSLARRFSTADQIATELATLEVFALPESYFATYADRVEAVTAADVRRVAQQYLDPARMTAVLVGDRKDVDRAGELGLGPIEYQAPAPAPPAKKREASR